MIIWRVNFGTGDDAALSGGWDAMARKASAEKWRRALECVGLSLSTPRFAVVDIAICASKSKRDPPASLDWFVSNNTYAGRWINWIAGRVCVRKEKEERLLGWKHEMCFISLSARFHSHERLEIMPSQQISSRKRGPALRLLQIWEKSPHKVSAPVVVVKFVFKLRLTQQPERP